MKAIVFGLWVLAMLILAGFIAGTYLGHAADPMLPGPLPTFAGR